jgi:Sulphur transport
MALDVDIALTSLAFVFCALCVGVMGFAIQRGATCTVAAVDEVVGRRGFRRLVALVEASVWVAGGLLVAQWLGALPKMPPGYPLSGWTVLGGALLGLGAFVNGACVFGAIALFGSGRWAQILMPLGFYLGCLSVKAIFEPPSPAALPYGSPVLQAPAWVALAFVVFVGWRLLSALRTDRHEAAGLSLARRAREALASRVWSPHAATTVIGITFLLTLLLAGAWAYTDLLVALARGMASNVVVRCMLALALLIGAVWGGWTAGRFQGTRVTAGQALRSLAGGVLMGWGSLLIPGSNDGLILVGMPLLWPYAWAAFVAMVIAIAAAQAFAAAGSQ